MVVLFILRRNQKTSITLLCVFFEIHATEFRFHLKSGQSHLCMCAKNQICACVCKYLEQGLDVPV